MVKQFKQILCLVLCLIASIALFAGCSVIKPSPDDSDTGSGSSEPPSYCSHVYGEWQTEEAATCVSAGTEYQVCKKCNDKKTRTLPALGHNFVDGTCVRCNAVDPSVANSELYTVSGDYVYFGSYPQIEVVDKQLISDLNAKSGGSPSKENGKNWVDYKYYVSGENDSPFMWYQDVKLNDEKYRGVYFTDYRPISCVDVASEDLSYQDDNGYKTNTAYWFKFEKIKWKILSKNGDKVMLISTIALDAQPYDYDGTSTENNYAEATIRKWLNESFYNAAFNGLQRAIIQGVNVENGALSTLFAENKYACENTFDKIFLASAKEITETDYGFNSSASETDGARAVRRTNYAKVQGCMPLNENGKTDDCDWWLRSPHNFYASDVRVVLSDGKLDFYDANSTNCGVVPVLWLDLINGTHTEHIFGEWKETQPASCEESGLKTRLCDICGEVDSAVIDPLGHTEVIDKAKAPNCTETGLTEGKHCSVCNKVLAEQKEIPALGHEYKNGVCVFCGEQDPDYKADVSYVVSGDYVYFGSYPQTEVTDKTIVSSLNSQAGTFPSSGNDRDWKSYGYYEKGSAATAFMWYKDVEYDGEKYRGVYFTNYRSRTCNGKSSNTFQDDNGYFVNTAYWFKFEQVKWKIIGKKDGGALLLCETALDSLQYDYDGTYSNNYAASTIRKWLNETFYNLAFNDAQKAKIKVTNVDNGALSTLNETNPNACENTFDKIFLPSAKEITENDYGFSSDESAKDFNRRRKTSDYAKSQGCYSNTTASLYGFGFWWLRSPDSRDNRNARVVHDDGSVYDGKSVISTDGGIVPMMWINTACGENGAHKFGEWQITATCLKGGYKYKSCVLCGATEAQEISALGHVGEKIPAVKPTCTAEGLTEGEKCSVCDAILVEQKPVPKSEHIGEIIPAVKPTCTAEGLTEGEKCSVCDAILVEQKPVPKSEHKYVNGKCVYCEKVDPSAGYTYEVDEKDENSIYFGSYPQTEVTDKDLISKLNLKAGALPEKGNGGSWISYNYYSNGDDSAAYSWYKDLSYYDEKYRGIYFIDYRPYKYEQNVKNAFQQDNGYGVGTVYWFKFEKIKWRKLTENNGDALLLCSLAIDSREYDYDGETSNDYASSTVRKWLNDAFYATAFNDLQKEMIKTTTVENGAPSTLYQTNPNACADTSDKIFLPSAKEMASAEYGFEKFTDKNDEKRTMKLSDYAKSQGGYESANENCFWWLRSPSKKGKTSVRYVDDCGCLAINNYANVTYCGIVPALWIRIGE